jgi:hypothetical protein
MWSFLGLILAGCWGPMRHSHDDREQWQSAYNLPMADRILCSCVTCPKCGTWIVVEREIRSGAKQGKFRATCGVPECGKEFEFEDREIRVFELPPSVFERRHFYRSELRDS